jgi:hypothetical protein
LVETHDRWVVASGATLPSGRPSSAGIGPSGQSGRLIDVDGRFIQIRRCSADRTLVRRSSHPILLRRGLAAIASLTLAGGISAVLMDSSGPVLVRSAAPVLQPGLVVPGNAAAAVIPPAAHITATSPSPTLAPVIARNAPVVVAQRTQAPAPVTHVKSAPAASGPVAPAAAVVVPTTAAPAALPVAATGPAPRTQPSAAAVQQAIDGLQQYLPLAPSADQVAQVGDQICSAFDAGQSYSQVLSSTKQTLGQVPMVSNLDAASAYAVQQSVALYCPGYTNKLG